MHDATVPPACCASRGKLLLHCFGEALSVPSLLPATCREVDVSLEEGAGDPRCARCDGWRAEGKRAYTLAELLSRRGLERPCATLVGGRERRRTLGMEPRPFPVLDRVALASRARLR
jgi:hypothetical protein